MAKQAKTAIQLGRRCEWSLSNPQLLLAPKALHRPLRHRNPVDSCGAVVCAALSEREAVAGSTATTRTGDPVGWQSLPVWPPIQDKFTLICWIKKKERAERINLHHSSALLWQRRKSMFEIWPYAYHHCVTVALACHFMHAACIVVSECHGQLSLHNVM